jgi:hypothetical protein
MTRYFFAFLRCMAMSHYGMVWRCTALCLEGEAHLGVCGVGVVQQPGMSIMSVTDSNVT